MKRKKRLVVLSTFNVPFLMYGAEQMAKEIVERIGDDYETTLITAWLDRSLKKYEQHQGFNIIRVGVGHRQIDKILYLILAPLKVRKLKPQIVHAIMESYAGGALVFVKYLYPKAKRILTLQSGDLDDQRNQKRILFKLIWKKIHASPDYVTAISTFLGKRAESLGVDKKNISITPNGVDFAEIPAQEEKISNRVVCMARLSWEKGLDYLIKSWPKVLENVANAKLVLLGDGNKRNEIEKMIIDLKIGGSVELKGRVPHDVALNEVKKSEIFVLPSLAEGLGNVFIEAQACGVTPIGTNVGGIPDVIQHGENGLLIRPKNSEDISEAIIRLLTEKEYSKKLSERGYETVKKFDWEVIVKQFDKIYRDILRR